MTPEEYHAQLVSYMYHWENLGVRRCKEPPPLFVKSLIITRGWQEVAESHIMGTPSVCKSKSFLLIYCLPSGSVADWSGKEFYDVWTRAGGRYSHCQPLVDWVLDDHQERSLEPPAPDLDTPLVPPVIPVARRHTVPSRPGAEAATPVAFTSLPNRPDNVSPTEQARRDALHRKAAASKAKARSKPSGSGGVLGVRASFSPNP